MSINISFFNIMKLNVARLNKLRKKYKLTSRETEIIKVLFLGINDNREIGDLLGISFRTAKMHLNNIYKKFSVNNKLAIVIKILDEM